MARNYSIRKVPGSQRHGIFVDGMLIAKIERGMEQEAGCITKFAELFMKADHLRPPRPHSCVGIAGTV